jgi:iron complex transport system permease protein
MIVMVVAAGTGAFQIAPLQVVDALLNPLGITLASGVTDQQSVVLWNIRLPRVLMGAVLGAGMAVAGAMLQGLFRNPLADPSLVGVSSGAGLAAAFVIVLGTGLPGFAKALGVFTLPLAAFFGGLAVTLLIQRIGTRRGVTLMPMMLLAGIGMAAIAEAGIGLLSYASNDEQLRSLSMWRLGSLGPTNWITLSLATPIVGTTLAIALWIAPRLNALLLGESEAMHLGVNVQTLKRQVIGLAALTVGVLVAFCGMVGFIGLVAPHCVRLVNGPDHRLVLPASALLGAALVVAADLIARTAFAPAEIPLGVLTALMGAPFFLVLLVRERRSWGL